MTNSSHAHLGMRAISWHLFHGIHLPLRTSMIRGEIKLFIILFLRPSLVAPHLKQHSGILMALSGNDDQHKSLDFAAESMHGRRSSVWNKSLHETLCKHVNFTHETTCTARVFFFLAVKQDFKNVISVGHREKE